MDDAISTVVKTFWYIGFALSCMCLITQIFLYTVLPSTRKLDQKILTQLTVARIINIVPEYMLRLLQIEGTVNVAVSVAIFTLSDAALVFWMFVFTKNLHDKVINGIALKKVNFVRVSLVIWFLSLLITIPFVLMYLQLAAPILLKVIIVAKHIVLLINFIIFCRIFWVIVSIKTDRDLKSLLKVCLIYFVLVSLTSLRALVQTMFIDLKSKKLYGEDLDAVILRFRKTPDYLAILNDEIEEMKSEVYDMVKHIRNFYFKEMPSKILELFGVGSQEDELMLRSMDYNIWKPSHLRDKEEIQTVSQVKVLDAFYRAHQVLSAEELNHFSDLGFEYAGRIIHAAIKHLGGDDTSSTRLPDGDEIPADKTTTKHVHDHQVTSSVADETASNGPETSTISTFTSSYKNKAVKSYKKS